MPSPELQPQIDAARAYEALHVPSLFGDWAAPVLDAAGVRAGDRVLDLACGTGVVAREAVARVGERGAVAGVDPGVGMLAVAAELAPEAEFRQGTADALPHPDGAFDVLVSQFGMMFFGDPAVALAEMQRVLVPGGRMAVAVWDAIENFDVYPEAVALLERLAGPAAGDALRVPFALGDGAALAARFRAAGLEDVRVTTRESRARFPSVRRMMEAELRGWLPVMGVHLDETQIEAILAEAERALGRYVTPDGRMEFRAPGHIVTARKPA